jgi:ABC-type transport system involved in cytochrome c biogenesis permease subunit
MNLTASFDIWFISIVTVWVTGMLLIMIPLPRKYVITGNITIVLGFLILSVFLSLLWIRLQSPPMRTVGETRLWYSLFLGLIGYIIYQQWKYKWLLVASLVIASLFLYLNYRNPENFNKYQMPALQSPWFIPHVITYTIAYAFLVAASIVAYKGLITLVFKKYKTETLVLADNLVHIGFAFLSCGLLLGAFWAKQAWGHYWTWDPKEIWAAITWFTYILYAHLRYYHSTKKLLLLCFLGLAFLVLLFCWMGLNYLPAAQHSIHMYTY